MKTWDFDSALEEAREHYNDDITELEEKISELQKELEETKKQSDEFEEALCEAEAKVSELGDIIMKSDLNDDQKEELIEYVKKGIE